MVSYVPDRGDIIWIDFSPNAGHEQANRRPALIISPKAYNQKVRLALMCPITSKIKGYPFEVAIPKNKKVSGVILSDQIRSFDWQARNAEFICRIQDEIIDGVIAKIQPLICKKT